MHAQSNKPILGSLYLSMGMACYVVNDTLVKMAGETLQLGTILVVRGGIAIVLVTLLIALNGQLRHLNEITSKPVVLRALFDTMATFLFLTALFNISIATATALIQVAPLVVVIFGVVFLNEKIGWRRIAAIFAGFVGVMLIVQPGTSAFNSYSLLVLAVVVLVAMRDTVTRNTPMYTPSLVVTLGNVLAVTIAGFVYFLVEGPQAVNQRQMLILAVSAVFLMAATIFMVLTVRTADLSATAPMRYTAIIWSLLAAYLVFDEAPNKIAISGIVLIAVSGIYAMFRAR